MRFKRKLLFSVLIVSMLLLCIGIVSASDNENVTLTENNDIDELSTEVEPVTDDLASDENDEEVLGVDENEPALSDDEGYVIYVGQNTTTDGGNGSYENPFASLDLACNNVGDKEDITIKIFNGTYDIATEFNFNAKKISIIGDGDVIFKYSINKGNPSNSAFSFILTSAESNITFKNIIFDGSTPTVGTTPIRRIIQATSTNIAEFYNCSFLGYKNKFFYSAAGKNPISKFYGCNFALNGTVFTSTQSKELLNFSFKYCSFSCPSLSTIVPAWIDNDGNILSHLSIAYNWFGLNSIPSYVDSVNAKYISNGANANKFSYYVSNFAIFSVTENYIGDNQYEIMGKLTWNGTDSQEGMENFAPMTVKLQSNTGNIAETAVLEDGTFRAVYTSNSPNNYVSATLDNEEIELEFINIDMFLEAPAINVGDDQNVTITLPQAMTTTVTLIVNNKTYYVEFDNTDSVTYTIEDILGEGNYTVEAVINKDGVHAQNSTILSISKVADYEFNVITPFDVVYGDVPVLEIELPDDSTGNVTVLINNKTYVAAANKTVSIPIDNLVAGDNEVTTTYGSERYEEQTKNDVITVEKADAEISAEDVIVNNKKLTDYTVTLKDSNGNFLVNETLIVTINNETQEIMTDSEGIARLPEFSAGIYSVNILFNDSNYNPVSKDVKISVIYDSKITIVSIDGALFEVTCVLKDIDGNPIANADVSYALNSGDKVNVTTDEKGLFNASIMNDCVVDFVFDGGNGYAPCNSTITLKNIRPTPKATMVDVPSTMKKTAVDYKAGEKGTMFYFYLRDADGKGIANKAIKIGIFDKIYTVKTDSNGRGGLQINIANANYYTYGISFLGDDDYKASFAVCSLEIVKKSVTITPAKTTYTFKTSAKTKTITATLKSTNSYIPKGKQVTLTIAGKTFKATVGDKGQISLNVGSVTAKGTYKVAIKFAGTNTYAAATSKTITVKIS